MLSKFLFKTTSRRDTVQQDMIRLSRTCIFQQLQRYDAKEFQKKLFFACFRSDDFLLFDLFDFFIRSNFLFGHNFCPSVFDEPILKNLDHSLGESGRVNLFEPAGFSISNSNNSVFDRNRVDDDDEWNPKQVGRFISFIQIKNAIRRPNLEINYLQNYNLTQAQPVIQVRSDQVTQRFVAY